MTRKKIPNSVRFEVFKRDSFKCQYCGRCAPEIVLELEHIEPHSRGGSDEVLNLLTSCRECNSGKSDRLLSDDTVIQKQRAQLEELEERRHQLEMMLQWREANRSIDSDAFDAVTAAYERTFIGWSLNEYGETEARKLVKKFGLQRVLDAFDRAASMVVVKNGKATEASVDKAWRCVWVFAQPDDVQTLYRSRGLARKRCEGKYFDNTQAMNVLRRARKAGVSDEAMMQIAGECRNWSGWRTDMESAIEAAEYGERGDD